MSYCLSNYQTILGRSGFVDSVICTPSYVFDPPFPFAPKYSLSRQNGQKTSTYHPHLD